MMKDGTPYTGNQMYAGRGIQRFCPLCQAHRNHGGGFVKPVQGVKQWVCGAHPKAVGAK